jgi:hypothetical protein
MEVTEMNKRLTKSHFKYLVIIFLIWRVVDYYSRLFEICAGDDPAQTPSFLYEKDGITHIRFDYAVVQNSDNKYTPEYIQETCNTYLRGVILPHQKLIPPYSHGCDVYDITEALYIAEIEKSPGYLTLDIIYIDNDLAYQHVRKIEKIMFGGKTNVKQR